MTLFPQAGFELLPAPAGSAPGSSYFKVSEHSRCFDGHFDGAPILPGVAHIALALSACAAKAARPVALSGVRDLRFKRPIRPGDEVEVALSNSANATGVQFEIRCQGEPVTAGLLVVDPADGWSLA